MTGNIVLCSRDSLALEDRFYQGSLSHLSLFSSVLSADQIMSLYTSVMGGGLAPSPGLSTSLMESAWLNQFSNDTKLQVDADHMIPLWRMLLILPALAISIS